MSTDNRVIEKNATDARAIPHRVSDEQWRRIERCIPPGNCASMGRSRIEDRECFRGVVWVLFHGAAWRRMPDEFPSASTCKQRLMFWVRTGSWLPMWKSYVEGLDAGAFTSWRDVTTAWLGNEPREPGRPRTSSRSVGNPEKRWRKDAVEYLWSVYADVNTSDDVAPVRTSSPHYANKMDGNQKL